MMHKEGGWFFLSHSHQDINQVRKIRNLLEQRGFEPLLFFLKCLTDDDEIENLIKREITEREWFIYVDSDNARNSKWVKSERDFICTLQDKKMFTINLDDDIEKQINRIASQLTVFLSYSHSNMDIISTVKNKLVEKEFLVLDDSDIRKGMDFAEQIAKMIDMAAERGFILLFLTEKSIKSEYVLSEIRYAVQKKAKLVPVYVGNVAFNLPADFYFNVGSIHGVHLNEEPSEEQIEDLVNSIKYRMLVF